MRTLLLFPPPTDPAHPPLGIAALAGYLRARGEDVSLMDLNIRAYSELLTPDFLSRCATRLRRRMAGFRRRRRLSARDLSAYRAVAENVLSADWLIERIEGALQRLREPATYASRDEYAKTTAIVRRAMQFVSAAHHPASWSIGGFVMSRYAMRTADVLAATEDRSENLFIPLFEAALPEIVALQPDVVGISLNYRMQMIPAMTLASMIRKALPQAFTVAGGGLVSFFEDDWNVLAPFRELVDAWIPFEGEKPLFDLIQALKTGGDLDGVAGLMTFRDGRAVCSPAALPLPLDELPPPRFDGLPLHDYLSPEPMVPLLTSRGCYWGRCAFCAHGHLYRAQYRCASAATVLETMRTLSRNYGVTTFYFVDEATQPRMALDLAESIAAEGLPLRWFTEARFERYFNAERLKRIAAGGCRMLMFGLESAVPRVLDLIEKGITPELAARILRDCTAAGIRTYVMFFTGFP
ncbi:MAG TPA: radical SAM protein, partial [Vicinamibacterales bacterium]